MSIPSPILRRLPLGAQWPCIDPFLFCAHHNDAYPAGNGAFGPAASLAGRNLGSDFSGKDGWSMYHGQEVPGFPVHPHRGFETITLVRQGMLDHADSLGAMARFGGGDVQWMTAGSGVQHTEMFPLLHTDRPNPLQLFQIWLNLPARHKMEPAHFTMYWNETIPRLQHSDDAGHATTVTVVAGPLPGADAPLPPPPASWAAQADSDVAVWLISLAPGARWTLPSAVKKEAGRMLYWYVGNGLSLENEQIPAHTAMQLDPSRAIALHNSGTETAELVLLQGRPIAEPVARYGPFVMNTEAEIHQAISDYRRTQFGGWPWAESAPVHGAQPRRFARRPGQTQDELPPAA
ncbi:pirin family protein [Comamonas nitrativorans]|uniref:Pirin family protein n=1 Tax=Comamonas nitrativorans TaxID=108437 RepID=A0ABV9GXM5_9BURK